MAAPDPAGDDRTITGLRVEVTTALLKAPFVTSVRRADAAQIVVVEARDAAGRVGMGEAAVSWRVTGESPQSVTGSEERRVGKECELKCRSRWSPYH